MTKPNDIYTMAHLFVSAVRLLEYKEDTPPSLDAICQRIGCSDEKGSFLLNRLMEQGIVKTVKSGFSDRIVVGDHLAIEDLPRASEESRLEQELKKFKKGKNIMEEKVAFIKAQQDQKKQDLFTEIEKKLKKKNN